MIFNKIGIYGLKADIEDAFLASLLTGDPALLIGKQGTGKTALVEAAGYALREYSKKLRLTDPDQKLFAFRIYDSSKLNFEDLVGFPNPKAMQEGRMEFIRSKTTAWDSDWMCFDEYNRQEPARQNNIFELQRSRRLMGINTGTKWITNCMNPFGMAGTEELDDALVDRNLWFLFIQSFTELSDSAKNAIVGHRGNSDGPGLRHWSKQTFEWDVSDKDTVINEKFASAGEELNKLMECALKHYTQLEAEAGDSYRAFVSRYVCLLSSEMSNKDWKVELSGRRAGMIYRGLLAFRAVDLAKADLDGHHQARDLRDSFKTVLSMTIPVGISMSTSGMHDTAAASIKSQVDLLADFFKASGKDSAKTSVDVIYELLTTKNFMRKIEILLNEVKDDVAKSQVWATILKASKDPKTPEGMRNLVTIGMIVHLMTVRPGSIPQALQSQIAGEAKNLLTLDKLNAEVSLKGPLAFYKSEVEKLLEGCGNMFSKLQAKLMIEAECARYMSSEEITKAEFSTIANNIRRECDILERSIVQQKLDKTNAKTPVLI